jgi:predicted enzyme related to lactoylglutathione lyase
MVNATDFVCIGTEDFERADRFYGDVLGLERSKQWGDMPAREYETGNLTVAVMQMDAFGQEFRPSNQPIAFQVDDVEETQKKLEAEGIEFVMNTMDSGVCHMATFLDPDGNAMMIHKRYAPVGQGPGD